MTGRRVAGVAVLLLIPIAFVTVAALAGQLAELGAAVVFLGFVGAVVWLGVRLLDEDESPPPSV